MNKTRMYRSFLIALLLCSASLLPLFSQIPENQSFNVANKAYLDSLYAFSHSRFKLYVETFPDSPRKEEAYLKMGICSFFLKKYERSLAELENVLQFQSSNKYEEALYWKGRNLFALRKWRDSLYAFNTLIETDEKKYIKPVQVYKGKLLFYLGRYDEAVSVFDAFLKTYPESERLDEVYFFKGKCFYEKSKFKEGSREFRRIVEEMPESAWVKEACLWLAECQYCLGNWNEAIQDYRKVLSLKNGKGGFETEARYGLGWAFFKRGEKGDLVRSADHFKWITVQKPASAYALSSMFKLGQCLERQEKYSEAIACFEKTVESDRYRFKSYFLMGRCVLQQGLFKQALENFKEAMKTPEKKFAETVRFYLAETLFNIEKYAAAIKSFNAVWNSGSNIELRLDARTREADCYFKTGKYARAIDIYNSLIENYRDYPQQNQWLVSLAGTYARIRRYAEAVENLKQVKPGSPLWEKAAYEAGRHLLYNLRSYEAAAEQFSIMFSRASEPEARAKALYYKGLALYNQGKYNEAAALFQTIVRDYEQSPLHPDAYFQLGQALENTGDNKRRLLVYSRFLRRYPKHPRSPAVLLSAGITAMNLDDHERAFSFFHRMITEFPESEYVSQALYNIARIADARGNRETAVMYFRKTAEEFPDSSVADDALYYLASGKAASANDKETIVRALELYEALTEKYTASNVIGRAFFDMAVLYESLGKWKKAVSFYRKSIASPGMGKEEALYRLAGLLYKNGDFENALNRYMEAIYLYPDSSHVEENCLQAARCFVKLKKKDEAITLLEKKKDLPKVSKFLHRLRNPSEFEAK